MLQKIEAKLAAFDDIYKKLASFVGPKLPFAYLFLVGKRSVARAG